MPTSTVENYLKQIYLSQQERGGGELVTMGRLAASVSVTPGTATSMVKALAEAGLLEYTPRGGVRLTAAGSRLARQVLRRHRLIEQFLVQTLGMDWAEVHDEAEELEHAVSEKVLERIDALLGYPQTDPHGDPIPRTDSKTQPAGETWSLADAPTDRPLCVVRVLDQSATFLQYLDRHGLTPGTRLMISARDDAADAVTVRPDKRRSVTLGSTAARKVLVGCP